MSPEQYIEERKRVAGDPYVVQLWATMEDMYHRQLWHELTMVVKQAVEDVKFCQQEPLMAFYDNFLRHFESRLSHVFLAMIALTISRKNASVQECHQFLEHICALVSDNPAAHGLCLIGMAGLKGRARNEDGKCTELVMMKQLLDQAAASISKLKSVTVAHTEYFKASASYYREIGDFTRYFKQALRYMSTISFDDIRVEDRPELAIRLAIAALLSDKIYVFGYLLQHPIMETLNETKHQWLNDMLNAFSNGDIQLFYSLKPQWSQQPDLHSRASFLEEKIRMLSLLSLAFVGPNNSRELTFESVASRVAVDINQAEFLIMKAMSRHLIRGRIDQTKKSVRITWVMPKILNRREIAEMAEAFKLWCDKAKMVLKNVESEGGDFVPIQRQLN
uniref:26S proteasome non-ATPase regulatory subunit 13 n=1 Tax=Trichuris muris TaxID=70415 RepID=A0A5S6QMB7_TRIMR